MAGLLILILTVAIAVMMVIVAAVRERKARGLGWGHTVALDDRTLVSRRYGLAERPDRLIRQGGMIIPEERKSGRKVWPSHRAQIGVYFLFIEDRWDVRPTHGSIVLGDGTRERVEITHELREWCCTWPSGYARQG
jgi:CRISPR-associated exonuclease Cas4